MWHFETRQNEISGEDFPQGRDFTAVLTVVEYFRFRTSSQLALGVFRFQLLDSHSTFLQAIWMPADAFCELAQYPTKCRSELLWTIVCVIMERFLNSVYNAVSKLPNFQTSDVPFVYATFVQCANIS